MLPETIWVFLKAVKLLEAVLSDIQKERIDSENIFNDFFKRALFFAIGAERQEESHDS